MSSLSINATTSPPSVAVANIAFIMEVRPEEAGPKISVMAPRGKLASKPVPVVQSGSEVGVEKSEKLVASSFASCSPFRFSPCREQESTPVKNSIR